MKRLFNSILRLIISFALFIPAFTSCEYQEIADGDYPEQIIYMPTAYYNPFTINEVPGPIGSTPTPGYPVRFMVDGTANIFNVLLGVYRAGVDSKGSFNVNVFVNQDTITSLIASGGLPADTELLPADKYSVVPSLNVKSGEIVGKFDLAVDLDFLVAGYPGKKYALGVGISSADRKVNEDLALTVILIDAKIMLPTAGFSFSINATDTKKVTFTNTSVNGIDYSWNFGDGSAGSAEKNPVHTYASAGNYTVTLIVSGVTGTMNQDSFSTSVTIP